MRHRPMTRRVFMLCGILLVAMLTACGGGGAASGGGGGGGQPPPPAPVLTAIAPSSVTAGAAAGNPATLTLSLYGSNFNPNSVAVLWNGTPLQTNIVWYGNPPAVSTDVLT